MPHTASHTTTKPKPKGPTPAQTRKLPPGLVNYMRKNMPKKKKG